MKIVWKGRGINEKAYDQEGRIIIKIDKNYFRPTEVNSLLGDYTKAKKILNWKPETSIKQLIKEMIEVEIDDLKKI